MKKLFNIRPLPTITLAFVAGILIAGFGGKVAVAVVAVIALMLLCLAIFYSKIKRRTLLALSCVAICLSMTITYFCINPTSQPIEGQGLAVSGRISTDNNFDADGKIILDDYCQLVLEDVSIGEAEKQGKILLRFTLPPDVQLYLGDRVELTADVYPYRAAITDSYSMSRFNDDFRYKAYYCDGSLSVVSNNLKLYEKIQLFFKSSLNNCCNSDTAEFIFSMTFGNSNSLDADIVNSFRATGTAHLFAVSGLHVGIIAAAIMLIVSKIPIHKIFKSSICIGFLIFFCYLTGWSPSTLRATLMIAIGLVATSFGWRNDFMSTVSLGALILLIIRPLWLFDLGFLMSFGAVVGIMTLYAPLSRLLCKINKTIGSLLALTIAVNVGLLPITMMYFGQISLICIVANLVVLPIISVLFPVMLLLTVMAGFFAPFKLLASFVALAFNGIISFVKLSAACQALILDFSSAWYVFAPYFAFLFFISDYCLAEQKPKIVLISVMAAVCFINSIINVVDSKGYRATIDTFDDGSNAYALVTTKDGYAVLLVKGQLSSYGRELVDKYYCLRRLDNIDAVVITQPSSYTSSNANYLTYCMQYWQCDNLHLFGDGTFFAIDDVNLSGCGYYGDVFVDVSEPYTSSICIGQIRITATTLSTYDGFSQILLDPPSDYVASDGQYCVGGDGYVKGMKNYVSSQFTFRIKNDNIIKDYTWGFVG
ncbi:MAG: ComEC/Rec2 family competence protein [Christensenellales bacterium]